MRKPPLDPIRFNCAVRCLALHQANAKVKEQIRAKGDKLHEFSCKEITARAEAYFGAHMEELINQALEDVWRMPSFARYRQTEGCG